MEWKYQPSKKYRKFSTILIVKERERWKVLVLRIIYLFIFSLFLFSLKLLHCLCNSSNLISFLSLWWGLLSILIDVIVNEWRRMSNQKIYSILKLMRFEVFWLQQLFVVCVMSGLLFWCPLEWHRKTETNEEEHIIKITICMKWKSSQ